MGWTLPLIFFYTDMYENTLINYVEFLGDTLNAYYTSIIHKIDNAEVNTVTRNISHFLFKIFYY